MLSLAGIPPLAGFFAKYYIFSAAIESGYTTLVVIAVAGSLIGVYYYFRPIIAVFSTGSEENTVAVSPIFTGFLLITAVASLLLGIAPGILSGILG
jgi:NADH-quinone oxidoreductase subunit N